MNREQESTFIQSFIRHGRRERARFELLSEKKRGRFLSRLCHDFDSVLDDRYMKTIVPPNSDAAAILKLLKQEGASDTCYAISANEEMDGKTLPLSDSLQKAVGFGMPTILICIPGKLAYFEAEQTAGPAPRFLMIKR